MNKKKLLILGGTKFVGLELIKNLENYEIHIISKREIFQAGVNLNILDRKNRDKLEILINNIQPEIILDMICYDEKDASSIVSIVEKLDYLKHYIMISTFFIYNYSDKYEDFDDLNIDVIEDNYTKNKYLAERQIFESSIFHKSTIVRFPFIISSDDYTGRFLFMVNNVLEKNEIKVDNLKCSFVTKKDAARALANLLESSPQGFMDISNKGCISLREMYIIIANFYNIDIKFIESSRDVYQIKKDICLLANKLKDFYMPNISEALKNELKDVIKS